MLTTMPGAPEAVEFWMHVSCMVCGATLEPKRACWAKPEYEEHMRMFGREPHSHGICEGDCPCRRAILKQVQG